MNYNSLAIVGPTSAGKTDIAVHLAKRLDGALVCCDILQFYEKLAIGSGLFDRIDVQGIETYLYHCRSITDQYLEPEEYYHLTTAIRRKIVGDSGVAIFEGGTSRYIRTLLTKTPAAELGPIFALGLFPEIEDIVLEKIIRKRLNNFISRGLLDEIKVLIDLGHALAQPITDGIAYKFFVPVVQGHLTFNEGVEKTVMEWKKTFYDQLYSIRQIQNITPVIIKTLNFDHIAELVENQLMSVGLNPK